MACIEMCFKNVWLLKIKSIIGPLSVIGASILKTPEAPSHKSELKLQNCLLFLFFPPVIKF
jgi:hypothetical protein